MRQKSFCGKHQEGISIHPIFLLVAISSSLSIFQGVKSFSSDEKRILRILSI